MSKEASAMTETPREYGKYGNAASDSVVWRIRELSDILPKGSNITREGRDSYQITLRNLSYTDVKMLAELLKANLF